MSSLALLSSLLLAAAEAPAQTSMVTAGRPEYGQHSGFWRFHFGEGYRDLWTTPFEAEVLDLRTYAGGLAPVQQVGSMQSIGLALAGGDGRSYTFRTLDKDPTRILPPEWRTSLPAKIFQDQTAAANPGASFVVPGLAEAAGIPHTSPVYVLMPDDPALGEFREAFGGKPGTLDVFPTGAAGGGFMGALEIIGTGELWTRWLEGRGAVDTQALLRARLFDMFIGDWDRHNGQWRWMRIPGREGYVALPEDRDQALSDYGGFVLASVRRTNPRFLEWSADYDNLEGLLLQGRDVDRWLLTGLERPAFDAAARELQARLADATIDAAVRRLPPPWYALRGEALARDLKARRDRLVEAAAAFYADLSSRPDVHGTDRADIARVEHQKDAVLVELSLLDAAGGAGTPYFHRRFTGASTREVRLYLHGGDDRYVATGERQGRPALRVVTGGGADRIDDSPGGTRVYEASAQDAIERGPGTKVSSLAWPGRTAKDSTPWLPARDFGSTNRLQLYAWWEPDPGFIPAALFAHTRYGFRKQPYSSMHVFGFEWKTKRDAVRASYTGDYRWSRPDFFNYVELWSDGASKYNFYGLGNETKNRDFDELPVEDDGFDDVYDAHQQELYAFVSLASFETKSRAFRVHLGPEAKWSDTAEPPETVIGQREPYGYGTFGQLGARLSLDYDSRGRILSRDRMNNLSQAPRRSETGVALELDGYAYPKALDVESAFGAVEGWLGGYWGARPWLVLAARAGGRATFGKYPWYEAAFIGGSDNVRGYRSERFAGDESFFATAEARAPLGTVNILFPLRFGVYGFADVGRVWLEGESSDKWHPGYGAGIFLRDMLTGMSVDGSVSKGDEGVRFYVGFNFTF